MTGCGGIGWMEVPQARPGASRGWRWPATAQRSQGWHWRWRRFRRDCGAAASFRTWLPVMTASTLVSGLILGAHAIGSERSRQELIRRVVQEQLQAMAHNLEVETRDWATWDETHLHATGRNPAYYGKGNYTRNTFLRLPFVMVLDRDGDPVSSAHWNDRRQRIEPLPPLRARQLLHLIPGRRELRPRTFLAMVEGQPHLLSLQLIANASGDAPPGGRLLLGRPLGGPDQAITRRALALRHYDFEPVHALPASPLGPLALAIRTPQLDGLQPLQISVRRPASERLQALAAIGVLLGLDSAVLTVLLLQAYRQRRQRRQRECRQQREQQRLRRALDQRDTVDGLTGLLNARGLLAAMEAQRQPPGGDAPGGVAPEGVAQAGVARALLLLDIRHFALINHSFGRAFGDRVLIAFARWLEQHLDRSSLVARCGGDEFSCCLVGPSGSALRSRIEALTGALQQLDLPVDGRTLRLAVSAGARLLADAPALTALQDRGVARDLAKRSGSRQCLFYGDEEATMQTTIAIQRLNQELVASLKQNRIALFAQAAWRLDRSDLPAVYVEFLSRLEDPEAEGKQRYRWSEALVEAATLCGTMPLLDSHVLELSCRSLQELLSRHRDEPALDAMVFAINLTADTLLADDFSARVESLLERHGLDPQRLCFEITEQAAVHNLTVVTGAMQRLRRLGLRFALDDFGAGMTSLSHLRDLPLDYVKIDKAFIWRVKGDPSCRLTVDFLVRMGRELGFEIIAEGVEDLPLLYFLRDLGVTIAQGYVTSIPSLFDGRGAELGFSRCGRERLGLQLSLVG